MPRQKTNAVQFFMTRILWVICPIKAANFGPPNIDATLYPRILVEAVPTGGLHFGKNARFKSFLASLDDIQIWNRFLSDQEVVDLFQGGTP